MARERTVLGIVRPELDEQALDREMGELERAMGNATQVTPDLNARSAAEQLKQELERVVPGGQLLGRVGGAAVGGRAGGGGGAMSTGATAGELALDEQRNELLEDIHEKIEKLAATRAGGGGGGGLLSGLGLGSALGSAGGLGMGATMLSAIGLPLLGATLGKEGRKALKKRFPKSFSKPTITGASGQNKRKGAEPIIKPGELLETGARLGDLLSGNINIGLRPPNEGWPPTLTKPEWLPPELDVPDQNWPPTLQIPKSFPDSLLSGSSGSSGTSRTVNIDASSVEFSVTRFKNRGPSDRGMLSGLSKQEQQALTRFKNRGPSDRGERVEEVKLKPPKKGWPPDLGVPEIWPPKLATPKVGWPPALSVPETWPPNLKEPDWLPPELDVPDSNWPPKLQVPDFLGGGSGSGFGSGSGSGSSGGSGQTGSSGSGASQAVTRFENRARPGAKTTENRAAKSGQSGDVVLDVRRIDVSGGPDPRKVERKIEQKMREVKDEITKEFEKAFRKD